VIEFSDQDSAGKVLGVEAAARDRQATACFVEKLG
jgi:hypothetical protein